MPIARPLTRNDNRPTVVVSDQRAKLREYAYEQSS